MDRRYFISTFANMKSETLKGNLYAILSASTFGTIPLFSVPLMKAGFALPSVLIYRYAFGCIFMLAVLLLLKKNMRIDKKEALEIAFCSLLYTASSICLFEGYNYMPSGVATTLLFSYPVWTELLLIIFVHEKLTLRISFAIIFAVLGVAFLGGIANSTGAYPIQCVLFELCSGLCYAVYMVIFPRMKICRVPALKVNFYIFIAAMLYLLIYSGITTGGIQRLDNWEACLSLILLGLIPTTISNLALVKAMRFTSSANVAILGAFEPLTAIIIGIFLLGEPLTLSISIGIVLIIAAVSSLIIHGNKFLSYYKLSSLIFHKRHTKRNET